MHLVRKNGSVFLFGGTEAVKEKISLLASYLMPNYNFSQAYMSGLWDGRKRMVKKMRKRNGIIIPWGFFWDSALIVRAAGGMITDDTEIPPPKFDWTLEDFKLRPYQRKAVDAFDERGGVLHIPTGGGKTLVAAALIARFGVPTLYIVRGLDIVSQTCQFLQQTIGGQHPTIRMIHSQADLRGTPPDIAVCSINTLHSASKKTKRDAFVNFMRHYEFVIGDECHEVGCEQFLRPLSYLTANLRVFCSGTPYYEKEHRDIPLKAVAGNLFYSISTEELIRKHFLVRPEICFIRAVGAQNGVNSIQGLYQDVYELGIVKNAKRNTKVVLLVNELTGRGRKVLILVRKLSHGRLLEKRLISKGINTKFLHGAKSVGYRRHLTKKFRLAKEGRCLIATSIFDKGIDIPELDALVIAAGGREPLRALQRLGRGLRASKKKKDVLVFDFMDYQNKRYLLRHSKERLKTYKNNGFKVRIASTTKKALGT